MGQNIRARLLFLLAVSLPLCLGAVINVKSTNTPVTLTDSTDIASNAATKQTETSDPVKVIVTEGEIPEKGVDERAVGRALNWLRTRESFIHADKGYLDDHPKHTVLPWGEVDAIKGNISLDFENKTGLSS